MTVLEVDLAPHQLCLILPATPVPVGTARQETAELSWLEGVVVSALSFDPAGRNERLSAACTGARSGILGAVREVLRSDSGFQSLAEALAHSSASLSDAQREELNRLIAADAIADDQPGSRNG